MRKLFDMCRKTSETKETVIKRREGEFDFRIATKTLLFVKFTVSQHYYLRWQDNELVQLIATFMGPELGDPVKRWNGKEKKLMEFQCPEIINQYNKPMGGVDLCDILMSLFRVKLGTKK